MISYKILMPQSQNGYLVPLNGKQEEDSSKQKLALSSSGENFIGRNNFPTVDKRLSRKHISITLNPDGSANLVVEGSNPVVIHSGSSRKKLGSRENARICDGDVLELIPGNYIFKYVKWVSEEKRKRMREGTEDEVSMTNSKKVEVENGNKVESNLVKGSSKSIRDFHVSEDLSPMTFRLLSVKGLPPWANTSCVSIGDVIQGDILFAVLSNYMVDIDWLIPTCPALSKVPHVLVIHGEGDASLDHMKRNKTANWVLHKPPLPISYGTHHSKAMLLVYPQGIRVIVHTANLIYVDWNNKSQGLWMQDFPWKDQTSPSKGSGFESDLIDYLTALKWPEFTVNLPSLGSFNINPSFFRKFDYGNAAVRLIASIPGYHSGNNLRKWGHMKLRTILQECTFDKEFWKSPLVYQFSSLGSLDEKWLAEFASSLSSGSSEDRMPLGLGDPQIIWPTVEDVRCSLEGYAAGNAIPGPVKNVEKPFLKKYWAKWKATHSGRSRAMPHIKTFARYNGQKLAWFLLTSANLSKAAWGALQKNNSQLMIRSYELGVLFLPYKKQGCGFSCTKIGTSSAVDDLKKSEDEKANLVTLTWPGNKIDEPTSEVIQLPLPYELPPQPYSPEDVPWSWDCRYNKEDVYGQIWPRHVKLYASQDDS